MWIARAHAGQLTDSHCCEVEEWKTRAASWQLSLAQLSSSVVRVSLCHCVTVLLLLNPEEAIVVVQAICCIGGGTLQCERAGVRGVRGGR